MLLLDFSESGATVLLAVVRPTVQPTTLQVLLPTVVSMDLVDAAGAVAVVVHEDLQVLHLSMTHAQPIHPPILHALLVLQAIKQVVRGFAVPCMIL